MIYAKLYPGQLIEEYRKTVRSLYNAYYGEDGLKNSTVLEWAAFAASCNLRDTGTHLCARIDFKLESECGDFCVARKRAGS
jgi:hypothetical protein